MWLFTQLAMALDTLPGFGRLFLLALLLTGALCGFARLMPGDEPVALSLLYRKGALLALIVVPAVVYLFDVKVPVPVVQVTRFAAIWPEYLAYGVLVVWLGGFLFSLAIMLGDLRRTLSMHESAVAVPGKLLSRMSHWQNRLGLTGSVRVICAGSEMPWHLGPSGNSSVIVLPAAAANWPVGPTDVLLLWQLAQICQRCWVWVVVGRLVSAAYWFAPWVGRLSDDLVAELPLPAWNLAQAAYRDPDGWHRDSRNASDRCETLQELSLSNAMRLLRVLTPNKLPDNPSRRPGELSQTAQVSFDDRWQITKRKHRAKLRNPYEQAYWLIAVASIVACVATTLTIRQAPPEFEPQYLNVKWQDQMMRRMFDRKTPAANHHAEEARP